jgi:hypothetical protein
MKPLWPQYFWQAFTLFVLLVLLGGTAAWDLPDTAAKQLSFTALRARVTSARPPLPDVTPVRDFPAVCACLDPAVLLPVRSLPLRAHSIALADPASRLQNPARAPPALL